MDEHTLRVLEWPRLLERLAAHTSNTMGREAALALVPSPFVEVVERRLQETREVRYLRDHQSGLPLGGIRDIREAVARAAVDQQLTPQELLEAAQTVSSGRRLKTFLFRQAEQCPLLAEMAGNMPSVPNLEAKIGECIADNGEIRDSATPELARIRSERKSSHSRLLDKLNHILSSERYRQYVQEPIITEREGRYCIPVRSENRSHFGGIVHDASASGATVFIEPGPCIELGNRLKELVVKEEQEVSRILSRLTSLVGHAADDLRALLGLLANIDLAHARACLAEEMNACEGRTGRAGMTRLMAARHPLLTGDVTPIDIEIGERFTVLLLTGPNTGGKTVALKTVGLLTLMRQAGMHVPASPDSEISLFEQVFADIGDEQDIQQSLSTFSAHLRNIVRIGAELGPRSLVLLDEVGAGTDPAEGAALAKAILADMRDRGARVIATTHYGELKEFAYTSEGVENAAVEFNRDTLRPTYRVLVGVPGSSHALYIARRLGLPEAVVEEARRNLSSRDQSSGELMQRIEEVRRKAVEHERDAAAARRASENLKREYEERVRQVTDVQRTIRREVEDEARAVLRRASDKAENILDELRKMNKGGRKAPAARKKLAALRSEVGQSLAAPEPEPIEPVPAGGYRLARGDRVRVVTLGADGVLLGDPAAGSVEVQIGAMRATLPVDVLRPLPKAAEPSVRQDRSGASEISMRKAIHIAPEVMIRAMRVEEAEPLLDKYIDDAYAAGLHEVRVIHGKGTGALRKFVQEYLRVHPVVRAQRPADDTEGGAGATIAIFKE